MWCLHNTLTHETIGVHRQRWASCKAQNEDGIHPFFSVVRGSDLRRFKTMDEAAKYAARYDLYRLGFVTQPTHQAVIKYDKWECRTCRRGYHTPGEAAKCCGTMLRRRA